MRQERTEWHSVVVWGKRAEALAKFLTKGSRLFIEGGLRTSSYDDKDGNKRYTTEIKGDKIVLARNPDYKNFGKFAANPGAPYMDGLVITTVPEPQARLALCHRRHRG